MPDEYLVQAFNTGLGWTGVGSGLVTTQSLDEAMKDYDKFDCEESRWMNSTVGKLRLIKASGLERNYFGNIRVELSESDPRIIRKNY